MNKISRFVSEEWRWILLYVMIGSVMYWTSIVIQPTFDILKGQQEKAVQIINNQNNNTALLGAALKQNQEIIQAGTNNTALLVEMFERQNVMLRNQIILVTKLTNATNIIKQEHEQMNATINEIKNKTLSAIINFILPAAMASEEEDIVGDILESENVSRNPPEVNSTEVATGQISGFSEPTVVIP